MPRNRDYTGLERTPPSMAWLIRQRAVLQGRLDQCRKQLDEIPRKIVELEAQLQTLDGVFPLHDVKVAPAEIKGIKKKAKAIAPYGEMTRYVLRTLREAGRPVSTLEIALGFSRQQQLDITSRSSRARLTRLMAKRLGELCAKGVVQRCHELKTTDFGQWVLVADEDEDFEALRKAA